MLPATEPFVQSIVKPCTECNSLYRKRYEEGYDLYGEDYLQWIHNNNLRFPITDSCEVNATLSCTKGSSSQLVEISSVSSTHCGGSTGSSQSEILTIPKSLALKKRRQTVNAKTSCITDSQVLNKLKHQKKEREAKEQKKRAEKLERRKNKNRNPIKGR